MSVSSTSSAAGGLLLRVGLEGSFQTLNLEVEGEILRAGLFDTTALGWSSVRTGSRTCEHAHETRFPFFL